MNLLRTFSCLFLLFLIGCNREQPAPASQNKAQEIINAARLKQLTTGLQLSTEQQTQVKALLVAENQEVEKSHASATEKGEGEALRLVAIRQSTYGKIRPLLTPDQSEKFDAVINKMEGRRKK